MQYYKIDKNSLVKLSLEASPFHFIKPLLRIVGLAVMLFLSKTAFPSNEMRGIWISDPTSFDWDQVIEDLEKAKFNNLFINFASAGVAFYPSKVLPSIGTKESLKELIEVAHKKNIKIHAKILAFFMYWAPQEQVDKMIKHGRVLLNTKGKMHLQANTPWLDPAQVENQNLIKDLIREILNQFEVDGIQLDYVRFYEEKEVPESIMQIRRTVITNFTKDIGIMMRNDFPSKRYSACIFYNKERAKTEMAQDWKTWIDQKIFNFLIPMNYTTFPEELIKWINAQEYLFENKTTFYCGLGAYMDKMTLPLLKKEIDIVRKCDIPGFVLFSYNSSKVQKWISQINLPEK